MRIRSLKHAASIVETLPHYFDENNYLANEITFLASHPYLEMSDYRTGILHKFITYLKTQPLTDLEKAICNIKD